MAVVAPLTPADVVRLAEASGLRVPDEDLEPVADALTAHLAFVEPMLRADLPDVKDVLATKDAPTEAGSRLLAGFTPRADATVRT
jgi:Asp-tRNA(Asn)/Glu-tRNA(Gln) amidotransferase A subunit family amidase